MDARSNAAPVIIKRKTVVNGGGHHGGAWKVAYADFVTAMMAFFLLMWLLGATTEKQRKSIADYFSPTVPINRVSGGGSGAFGGDSAFSEESLSQMGTGASDRHINASHQARGDLGVTREDTSNGEDSAAFSEIDARLRGRNGESLASDDVLRHIVTRVTDEGLIIELFDVGGAALFAPDQSEPTETLRAIARLIATVTAPIVNDIAIAGHTRARPVTLAENPVWDLSAARANRMRILLEEAGIARTRMRRITGHADRSAASKDPMSSRNNRLEVTFLRSH
ncbi:flagellar motor protein MotB [Roseovarius ramblicola]|uniref:Flagellar motor protein MotB n=1 Tax=Roseovarius ramblicola TaxID=2022336 RepID=A0ABV5HXL2_9RHOB